MLSERRGQLPSFARFWRVHVVTDTVCTQWRNAIYQTLLAESWVACADIT